MTPRKERRGRRGGKGGKLRRGREKQSVFTPAVEGAEPLSRVCACVFLCVSRALKSLHNLREVDQSQLELI